MTTESVVISPASFLLLIIHVFSLLFIFVIFVFHLALGVKNLPANAGKEEYVSSVPGSGRSSGGGNGTSVFLPGESHGQRKPGGLQSIVVTQSQT